jgi:hypothetical protein
MTAVWLLSWLTGMWAAAPPVAALRWQLIDLASGAQWSIPDDPAKLTAGGTLDSSPAGSDLRLRVSYQPLGEATLMRVAVSSLGAQERGVTVRVSLVAERGEWLWWQELDEARPLQESRAWSNTTSLQGMPGLPDFVQVELPEYGRYSVYPLGVMSRGAEWVGVGRRLGELLVARFVGVGGPAPELRAEVDLALSELAARPRQAEFALCFLCGRGQPPAAAQEKAPFPAFRAALASYQRLWAEDFQVRVSAWGGWMPFTDLAQLAHVDEFGFAYQEGGPNPSFDDALGVLSFVYFHCAGEFANVPGYQRGTEPLPSYEQVVAAFNAVAEQHSGVSKAWDLCGIRGPDGKIAYRPEKVYGDFFCQGCVDPALPYGRAMAERLLERVLARPFPAGLDGVYYDGLAAGLDYAPEHLKVAAHPLLWDAKLKRAFNYNLFSSVQWARYIHERLTGTGKLCMLNDGSLASFAFAGPYIDVPGGEMSINLTRREAQLIRIYTGPKPFCTLVKADFSQLTPAQLETYMRRCLAYGLLFGFFDIAPSGAHPGSSYWVHPEWYNRDRPLFRRYMPLARELAQAGWQPLPLASCTGGYVERFGPGRMGLTYLTVSTAPQPAGEREVRVRLPEELASQAEGAIAVELLSGRIERQPRELVMRLQDDDLAVWSLGQAPAQAEACLERARDLLAARARYLAACQAAAASIQPWRPYEEGGAKVVAPGREGGYCLEAALEKPGGRAGATQSLVLNQEKPQPLLISAWSKAEEVSGQRDADYALYVDCYYQDGTALYGQTVQFSTGTHGWEYGEKVIEPAKPVKTVNVYLLFRGQHTGRVWFDDVRVALAAKPQENLLPRGDFEIAQDRPLAGDSEAARVINGAWESLAGLLKRAAREFDFQAAERLLARIEQAAGEAGWGADGERTLRDVADVRWHLALAQACLRGQAQPAQRPARLTPHVALVPTPSSSGKRSYVAQTGRVPQGTTVTVDSLFPGYSAEPLTDGRINPPGVSWEKVAWASEEAAGEHWIELRLPSALPVREVKVWWAKDAGKLWISQQLRVEVGEKEKWRPAPDQQISTDRQQGVTIIRLSGEALKELRLLQPAQGGPPERPDIMWVSEVEID